MARVGASLNWCVKENKVFGRNSWSTTGDEEDVQRKKLEPSS